ncbi:YaiO family outer membrane beta-barrel protein [Allomuricauda sp. d1]|uniref:YaiO family outer membrane beta-barrel protein n=1 Tax=Allomuricauda sp. d1 TaxID=3136725 RepID=UPI0031D70F94
MKIRLVPYSSFIIGFFCFYGWSQSDSGPSSQGSYHQAYELAYSGDSKTAQAVLEEVLSENPRHSEASELLARTYSWTGQYVKARLYFNRLLSENNNKKDVWVAAIKNELYAGENAIALGLANKAMRYIKDAELQRLKLLAHDQVMNIKYGKIGWYNTEETRKNPKKGIKKKKIASKIEGKKTEKDAEPKNRIGVSNTVTVFNERYDPMFFTSISYKRKTPYGSIIPRINFSSRVGKQGVQYDIDLYPKFAKGFYAYLNYGYSNATIYPNHKMGGDVYMSLPGSFEFSAGARHIITRTRNVTGISNSLGHYRGNYYFSLRSLVTPKPDGLTRVSGNLLVRRYTKNSENYMGFTAGVGISPELRQFFADDELLAETIFFIETQRLNLEYQFTNKQNTNIYKARLGVRRQEISFDSGNFFWGITGGLIYSVKF